MKTTIDDTKLEGGASAFVLPLSNDGVRHRAILGPGGARMRSALVTLQPGEHVGSHNTGDHEEILVVLDGEGEVHAEGLGKRRVGRDTVVYIPARNQHDVWNIGSAPLRYVYVVSPVQ